MMVTIHSSSYGARNCSVVIENMYTIQYKEECGRRYNKVSLILIIASHVCYHIFLNVYKQAKVLVSLVSGH